ncbi:aminoglycoside phosphotransferase family protein [Dactylosporangium sp. NPDC051485]|uniref:phosphotransferase family protein n=1 Tax=Dactylosporangium sp. NPDC051485 TaxID=3154846 RepID=UPI00341C95D9
MRGTLQKARPVLRDHLARWLHREERRWTAAAAPRLVAGATSIRNTGWRTETVSFTSTSVAVATVIRSGSPDRYVVKVPWTAAGAASLRRQATVLAMLRQDPRLPNLRPVLPRCLAQGTIEGRYYCVEEALPGVSAMGLMVRRAWRTMLLRAATGLISDLHARTGEQTVLDRSTVRAWVDAPLRRLEEFALTLSQPPRVVDAVGRLHEELIAVLVGRTVRVSWIHGDFWPGNLLAAPPGGQVTGVVDWDCATPGQLPLHDLLHLHVLARRLTGGDELGDIVVRALHRGIEETLDVSARDVDAWLDTIPQRAALLLYWLRHTLLFIDSEGDHDNPRWLRGNVERVLVSV